MRGGVTASRGAPADGGRGDGPRLLVSACLAGVACRYDGTACPDPVVEALVRSGRAVPACPEQLGGLPTPRRRAEIRGGDGEAVLDGRARVVDEAGEDVTEAFLRGAREALRLARLAGAGGALLKARSPSCAAGEIHDGTFSGRRRAGAGVTAALLRREGLDVRET